MRIKPNYICILMLLLALATQSTKSVFAQGTDPASLNGLFSRSGMGTSRLTFDFDHLPTYELKTSGQRIDVILKNSEPGAALKHLPEDDKIIKVLVARDIDNLIVSLLLRRLPSHVVATPNVQIHQLDLAIRWDEAETVRPGIVFDLPEMPAVRRHGAEMRHTSLAESAYQGDWVKFLKNSHTPVKLNLSPTYSLPEWKALPTTPGQSIDKKFQAHIDKNDWESLLKDSAGSQNTTVQLLHIEAQIRLGQVEAAFAKLRTLKFRYPDNQYPPRFSYLLALSEATVNQPYAALHSLTEMLVSLHNEGPWIPLIGLLQSEIQLGLGQADRALGALETNLKTDIQYLQQQGQLRTADALALRGEFHSALEAYKGLPEGLLDNQPFSMAQAAFCCQKVRDYRQAREIFNNLAAVLPEGEAKELSKYGELTTFKRPESSLVYLDDLQRIRWDSPNTEVFYRALMKLTDLMAPGKDESIIRRQLVDYQQVAQDAPVMDLRQEADIKIAIMQHLLGDDPKAIAHVESILKNFKRGNLRGEALSLLGELLPPVIESYIRDQHFMDALVLVERDRDLLIQQPLSWDFLYGIAQAFDRLELDNRADKIFLYLYDRATEKNQKARACLLLAKNYLQLHEYSLVEQYAERYRQLVPNGNEMSLTYEYQLRARVLRDGIESAIIWFDKQNVDPESSLALYASQLYWSQHRYKSVVTYLNLAEQKNIDLPIHAALWLAEANYRIGKKELALKHFRLLFDMPEAAAQAQYRAATILLDGKENAEGIKLLNDVAKRTNADRWSQLATDKLLSLKL